MAVYQSPPIPQAFIRRRLHSLLGLGLVLFLCEHLLTNSQAALLIGDDGSGFVRMVNLIHSLPYLPVIEISLLGIPFLLHGYWGLKYILTSEPNSSRTDGGRPALTDYGRNKAYTWQRISSWILLVGVILHVVQMRFIEQPLVAETAQGHEYIIRLGMDEGLYTVAARLGVELYDTKRIEAEEDKVDRAVGAAGAMDLKEHSAKTFFSEAASQSYDETKARNLVEQQELKRQKERVELLQHKALADGQVIATSDNFGTAFLLIVRDTFKSPGMMFLYTVYVLMACFHAFNGLWTFCITWGVTLTKRSQTLMLYACTGLMFTLAFLGLACIWGTYWINLRY